MKSALDNPPKTGITLKRFIRSKNCKQKQYNPNIDYLLFIQFFIPSCHLYIFNFGFHCHPAFFPTLIFLRSFFLPSIFLSLPLSTVHRSFSFPPSVPFSLIHHLFFLPEKQGRACFTCASLNPTPRDKCCNQRILDGLSYETAPRSR